MTPNFRPDEILNDLHCIKLYPKSSRLLRTAALSLSRPELTWKTKRACAVPCFRPFSSEPVVVGRCFRSLMFILLYTGILSSILSWKDCFHFYLTASMPLPPPTILPSRTYSQNAPFALVSDRRYIYVALPHSKTEFLKRFLSYREPILWKVLKWWLQGLWICKYEE